MTDEAKLALGLATTLITALGSLVVASLNVRATRKLEREQMDRGAPTARRLGRSSNVCAVSPAGQLPIHPSG